MNNEVIITLKINDLASAELSKLKSQWQDILGSLSTKGTETFNKLEKTAKGITDSISSETRNVNRKIKGSFDLLSTDGSNAFLKLDKSAKKSISSITSQLTILDKKLEATFALLPKGADALAQFEKAAKSTTDTISSQTEILNSKLRGTNEDLKTLAKTLNTSFAGFCTDIKTANTELTDTAKNLSSLQKDTKKTTSTAQKSNTKTTKEPSIDTKFWIEKISDDNKRLSVWMLGSKEDEISKIPIVDKFSKSKKDHPKEFKTDGDGYLSKINDTKPWFSSRWTVSKLKIDDSGVYVELTKLEARLAGVISFFSTKWKNLTKANANTGWITITAKKIEDLGEKINSIKPTSFGLLAAQIENANRPLEKFKRTLSDVAVISKNGISAAITGISARVKAIPTRLKGIQERAKTRVQARKTEDDKGTFSDLSGAWSSISSGASQVIGDGMQFEKAMSGAMATWGTPASEKGYMMNRALEYSKEGTNSPLEIAEGFGVVAQNGYTTKDNGFDQAFSSSIALSKAMGIDLKDALTTGIATVQAFGKNLNDLPQINEMIARTAKNAAMNPAEIRDGFNQMATFAKNNGMKESDIATSLAMLAKVPSLRGTEGGKGLHAAFVNMLQSDDGRSRAMMKKIDFDPFDSLNKGKLKPMKQLIDELNNSLSKLGTGARTEALSKMFGKEGYAAMDTLLSKSQEEATDNHGNKTNAWNAMGSYITDPDSENKTLQSMAATMTDNLATKWERLKNTFSSTLMGAFVQIQPFLMGVIDKLTTVINVIEKYRKPLSILAVLLGTFVGIYTLVTEAQMLWNLAMALNPVIAIIAGIIALGAAIWYVQEYTEGLGETFERVGTYILNWLTIIAEVAAALSNPVSLVMLVADGFKPITKLLDENKKMWEDGLIRVRFKGEATTGGVPIPDQFKTSFVDNPITGSGSGGKTFGDMFGKKEGKAGTNNLPTENTKLTYLTKQAELLNASAKDKNENLQNQINGKKGKRKKTLAGNSDLSVNDNFGGDSNFSTDKQLQDRISAKGGGKGQNLNINIQKLVEKIEVHTTTVKEGAQNIAEQVKQALLTELNSINTMYA